MMNIKYPLLRKHGTKGLQIKGCEEDKELIEKLIREDTKHPAEVVAFNFFRKPVDGRTADRRACDIYVKKHLSNEKYRFLEGDVIKDKPVHSIIKKKEGKLHGNPLAPFGNHKNHSKSKRNRYKLSDINKLCIEYNLSYRAYSLKQHDNGKKIIFWSPKYGYGAAGLPNWVKSPDKVDPFREIKMDNKQKEEIKIFLFDLNLSDRFEVLDDSVKYDNTGVKLIPIFCKEHGNKVYTRIFSIKKQLTFNCPECATNNDFFNVKRIKHIRLHPSEDKGETIVALIILSVSGRITLKFGITEHKKIDLEARDSLERRYTKKRLKKILCYRKCKTELEARELEQNMLNKTLNIKDNKVPKFDGSTECRVYGESQMKICINSFLFAEYEYDQ